LFFTQVALCPYCDAKDTSGSRIKHHISSQHEGKVRVIGFHKLLVCREKRASGWAEAGFESDISLGSTALATRQTPYGDSWNEGGRPSPSSMETDDYQTFGHSEEEVGLTKDPKVAVVEGDGSPLAAAQKDDAYYCHESRHFDAKSSQLAAAKTQRTVGETDSDASLPEFGDEEDHVPAAESSQEEENKKGDGDEPVGVGKVPQTNGGGQKLPCLSNNVHKLKLLLRNCWGKKKDRTSCSTLDCSRSLQEIRSEELSAKLSMEPMDYEISLDGENEGEEDAQPSVSRGSTSSTDSAYSNNVPTESAEVCNTVFARSFPLHCRFAFSHCLLGTSHYSRQDVEHVKMTNYIICMLAFCTLWYVQC
jgi:hypothetical protein